MMHVDPDTLQGSRHSSFSNSIKMIVVTDTATCPPGSILDDINPRLDIHTLSIYAYMHTHENRVRKKQKLNQFPRSVYGLGERRHVELWLEFSFGFQISGSIWFGKKPGWDLQYFHLKEKEAGEEKNRKHNNSTKQGNRNLRKRNTLVWEKKKVVEKLQGNFLVLHLVSQL